MAKVKCPKKEKKPMPTTAVDTPETESEKDFVVNEGDIEVIFTTNVQVGNRLYKKDEKARFMSIDGFQRYCTVVQ